MAKYNKAHALAQYVKDIEEERKKRQQLQNILNTNRQNSGTSISGNAIAPIRTDTQYIANKILGGQTIEQKYAPILNVSESNTTQTKKQETSTESLLNKLKAQNEEDIYKQINEAQKRKVKAAEEEVNKEKQKKGIRSNEEMQEIGRENLLKNQFYDKVDFNKTADPRLNKKKTESKAEATQRLMKENIEKTAKYNKTSKKFKKLQEEENTQRLTQYWEDAATVQNEETTTLDKINPFRAYLSGLNSGITGSNYKDEKGRSIRLPSYNDLKAQKVAGDSGTIGRSYQGAMQSFGHMTPAMITSKAPVIGRVTGPATTFATTFNSAKNEKLLEGYSEKDAEQYATVNATLETGLSVLLGGVTKIMGGKSSALSSNLQKLTDKIFKSKGKSYFVSHAVAELIEEEGQTILDPINEHLTLGKYKNLGEALEQVSLDEITTTALSTLMTMGLSEGKTSYDIGNLQKNIEKVNKQYGTDFKFVEGSTEKVASNKANKETTVGNLLNQAETGKIDTSTMETNKNRKLTQNEQAVIDNIIENIVNDLKSKQDKVTKKDIAKIEKETRQDLERGYISTNDIERALSNEEWTKHDNVVKQKEKLENQIKELENKTPQGYKTMGELNSSNEELSRLKEQLKTIDTDTTRNELNSAMNGKITDKDILLQKSFGEELEKNNKYQFDKNEKITEQTKKINEDIKKLGLNNNIKTRDAIDILKKVSNETGSQYRLVNNNSTEVQTEYKKIAEKIAKMDNISMEEALKQTENLLIDGFVSDGQVFINVESNNLMRAITGHETTHLFEGTEDYKKLQKIAFKYAETKGEYNSRRKSLEKRYRGIENAKIDNELTSDLVGDYLFSDIEFVRNLSTEQPNIFKKIYNHVKHLYNMATAGSKEARQLEQLKYNFEKVYRENNQSKAGNNTKLMASKVENNSKIEYNKDGIYIKDKSEYGSLRATIRQFQASNPEFRGDTYVENGKYFYAFNSGEFDNYTIKMRIPIESNEELIDNIKEGIDNAINSNTKSVDTIINEIYTRRSNNSGDTVDTKDRKATRNNDRFYNSEQGQLDKTNDNGRKLQTNRELDSSFSNTTKYSISEKTGELQDNKGNSVKIETSDVGNTGTLMAMHNLGENKFNGILDLGGIPVPSIAITNPEIVNHSGFGDGTLIFNKSTIDPAVTENEVYDRDVWSPTYPRVEYDIDNEMLRKLAKDNKFYDNNDDSIIQSARNRYLYSENLSHEVNGYGIDNVLERMKQDSDLKYLYLKTKNNDYQPQMKPTKYSYDYSNETLQKYVDLYNSNKFNDMSLPDFYYHYLNYGDMNLTEDQTKALKATVRDMILPEIKQEAEEVWEKGHKTGNKEEFIQKYIDMMLEEYDKSYFKYKDFIKDASRLAEYGETLTIDESETRKKVEQDINQKEYEEWVDNSFGNMLRSTKKGIRNDVDLFTPSGNRRSFDKLHEEYNLSNLVKILTSKQTVGGEEGFGSGSNFGTIQAKMGHKFSSVEDIKNYESRLSPTNNEDIKELQDTIYDDMAELNQYKKYYSEYSYFDNAGYALNDFAEYKTQNLSNLKKALEKNDIDTTKVPEGLMNKVVKEINQLKTIPTDYFEAKPQRAVGLDEIEMAVIPNNWSAETKQRLTDKGIKYTEYDPSIEGDRQRVINQYDNLKFMLSNRNDIAPISNNDIRARDMLLPRQQDKSVQKAIAPLNKEIKALKQEVSDLKKNKQTTTYGIDEVPPTAEVFHGEKISDLKDFTKNPYLTWGTMTDVKDERARVRNELNFNENLTTEERNLLNTKEAQLSFALDYQNYKQRVAEYENTQNNDVDETIRLLEQQPQKKEKPKKSYRNDPGYAPYLEMAKEIEAERNGELVDTLNKADLEKSKLEDKQVQEQAKQQKKQAKKETSLKKTITYAQYLFTNRNAEIDKYAKETGNHNIQVLADHINNVQGEITTNINNNQIDNNGNVIGKSITQIFDQARQNKLSEAFNDYLFHKSNIERHKHGKGSLIPMNDSMALVQEYEKTYPEMKPWADEVNTYNKNLLYKQAEAGLITKDFADTLSKKYKFYVPFIENIDSDIAPTDAKEIKTRSTVKSARGGADKNLLKFEEAMIRQTQSAISQIRKNQLYQEIVKTKQNANVDFENNTNPDITDSGLMNDGKKYYLTAYVDGKRTQVEIDKPLYHGLAQNGNKIIRQAEQKLAPLTKPLQWLSDKRRNILTSWSPTFMITNPAKDIQDAPLNSKYAKDMIKNYPKAAKELMTGKGEQLDAFLNMYGQANLRGDYNLESGVSDVTKLAKTKSKVETASNNKAVEVSKKVLKKIPQINEIMELAPRYAEYMASLENGCSQMEALYNAREVTTNFGRGGIITKAMNRNGFTFLNANVQGMSKLIRNFSGENGGRAVLGCVAKAVSLGIAPALLNALLYDDDDDYEVIPDYIKDNYFLIKTSDNNFIRIPKGRMMSIFGSAARRTLEATQGREDAFEGYISNAYNQVGVQNPIESNIFAPLYQASINKTWYGTDLVPKRLQTDKNGRNIPKSEQYDASTDKMSIWLGKKLNWSPYKINYVLDQYSGGVGDMILPTMTEEAQSKSNSTVGKMIAPLKDKFSADSTTDNKYVTDFYSKLEELGTKPAKDLTKKEEMSYQYLRNISFEMGALYKEMREVQSNTKLKDSKKYAKVQNIKAEINRLAEEGMRGYKDVESYDNYARVGDRELYKYKNQKGETGWSDSNGKYADDINTLGLSIKEKNEYYTTKMKMSDVASKFKEDEGSERYRAVIKTIRNSNLPSDAKYELFNSWYGKNDDSSSVAQDVGISANDYLKFKTADLSADKNKNGYAVRGSKASKVVNYLNKTNLNKGQKAILYRMSFAYKGNYSSTNYSNAYNETIINYIDNSNLTYEETINTLKKLGFKVSRDGTVSWD